MTATTATETETKTATCICGETFPYEPAYRTMRGGEKREVLTPRFCDPCAKKRADQDEREQLEYQAEEGMRRFFDRVKRSELPQTRMRVPYPVNTPDAVRAWGAGEIDGLVLTGGVGVGKSHFAAAAIWHRLHREGVRWVPVARLLTQLRAGFGEGDRESARSIITGTG